MKEKLRILLLEDIAEEANLIERSIRKENISFALKRVDRRDEFVQAMNEFDPGVILSDHALPQFNSIEALSLCKQYKRDVPFILVTGTVSEEFAVTCLKHGADDYVLKSNLSRLPSAIMNAISQRDAQRKKQFAENELKRQNEELLRSNNELVKINRELDNFVYSVSHNLRSPLSTVAGLVNIARLQGPQTFEDFTLFLDLIERSINSLDDTLKEIIDYSRNGRGELKIEKLDIREIFHNAWVSLQYLEAAGDIGIKLNAGNADDVYSDAYRLKLIFSNLLSNAIRFSDNAKQKQITVDISVNEGWMTIVCEDNGIGIRQEYLYRIFDMFYRASEKSNGAGLGLYIVKEAVQKLNGMISVESEFGKGTKFKISIPVFSRNDVGLIQSSIAK